MVKEKKKEITVKEKTYLEYLVAGYTDEEIAQEMKYSYPSIRNLRNNLATKAAALTKPQLVAWAFRNGIIK